ncbi:MAG: 1-deoxy-D-xylulose-5-phosphate reductoisomerase [Cellvibrionales bacterium]|nr:1-deoxy-D-xylulose-5-phosphate reductoisomerase [Cellvibrionales bacterium]
MQNLVILGATGSIGTNTLDVVSRHPEAYQVHCLVAQKNDALLFEQCVQCNPSFAWLENDESAKRLALRLSEINHPTEVLTSYDELLAVISDASVTTVVSAMVGAKGLVPTLSAIQVGKKVLLANKESLVTAGQLFMDAVKQHHATLIPLDSEHSAIFQCLPNGLDTESIGLSKLILTASGGPFRTKTLEEMRSVTPAEAVAHPNWSMGQKISVDSASMMNKGLELIEAHWLFGVPSSQIDIVVHPESIVHSMAQFVDGSTIAHLGDHDMRCPISVGLSWPQRITSGVNDLDLVALSKLHFEAADETRFLNLKLARNACEAGQSAAAILNAANEVAVEAFLQKKIGFLSIAEINDRVLQATPLSPLDSIESVIAVDTSARQLASSFITKEGG